MKNYKLTIQYNGGNYAGWQIQNNAVTVQQKIIDAVEIITKERVNLIGSGRTDSGVHALGQAANFRTEQELDLRKFSYSLNSILPKDISIVDAEEVADSFHARFDAKKRSYIYLISLIKSPFYYNYSYHLPRAGEFDIVNMNSISKTILGEHDFTSFSKKNSEVDNRICTIYNIHWRRSGSFIVFYIEANRFLHGMVRTVVGTILNAEINKLDENCLLDVLSEKDREKAEESAPAKGLFLYKVRY